MMSFICPRILIRGFHIEIIIFHLPARGDNGSWYSCRLTGLSSSAASSLLHQCTIFCGIIRQQQQRKKKRLECSRLERLSVKMRVSGGKRTGEHCRVQTPSTCLLTSSGQQSVELARHEPSEQTFCDVCASANNLNRHRAELSSEPHQETEKDET